MIFESKNNETRSTPPHTKSTLFLYRPLFDLVSQNQSQSDHKGQSTERKNL